MQLFSFSFSVQYSSLQSELNEIKHSLKSSSIYLTHPGLCAGWVNLYGQYSIIIVKLQVQSEVQVKVRSMVQVNIVNLNFKFNVKFSNQQTWNDTKIKQATTKLFWTQYLQISKNSVSNSQMKGLGVTL